MNGIQLEEQILKDKMRLFSYYAKAKGVKRKRVLMGYISRLDKLMDLRISFAVIRHKEIMAEASEWLIKEVL